MRKKMMEGESLLRIPIDEENLDMSAIDPNTASQDVESTVRSSDTKCKLISDLSASEPEPIWTQEQAIAFESARECITHLMAIFSREIHEIRSRSELDGRRISALIAARRRLAGELQSLRLTDQIEIRRIREEYGALVRSSSTGNLGIDAG